MRGMGMPGRRGYVTFFVVLAALGSVVLSGTVLSGTAAAQSATEWDTRYSPADDDRPAEYRTVTTDEWMRLSPYIGLYRFSHDLELMGRLTRDTSANLGLRFEFDPADLMLITFDFGVGGHLLGSALGTNVERRITRNTIHHDHHIEGKLMHLSMYIALKDPALKFGPIQTMLGVGFGAFYLFNYGDRDILVKDPSVAGGVGIAPIDPPFEDTWVFHTSVLLRFDVDISEGVKFGFDTKVHFLNYAMGDVVGDMLEEEFELSRKFTIIEPTLYFSICF